MAVPKPVSPLTTPPANAPVRRMAICSEPMTAFADQQEELRYGKVAGGAPDLNDGKCGRAAG